MDFEQLAKQASARADLIARAQQRMEKLVDFSIEEIGKGGNAEPVGIQIFACVLHLNFWVSRYAQAVGCTPQHAIEALLAEVAKHTEIVKH